MLIFYATAAFLIGSCLASSLSARIDENGLNLFTEIGREVAENAIRTWKVDYKIDGNHVRNCDWRTVQLPKVSTSVSNGMFNVTTQGGMITARCHIVIKIPLGEIGADVELLLDGLNTATSLRASNITGEAEVASCKAVLGALDVQRVHGGIAIHIAKELFAGEVGRAFRRAFNDRACKVTAQKISIFNSWLFPFRKDLFTVEYGALKIKPDQKALEVTADIAFHYGKGKTCKADFESKMVISDSKMLSVGFSEPVAQCLLKASHEREIVLCYLNSTDPEVKDYLRTTCGTFEICIGRLLPKMQEKYPNETVDITIYTSKSPEISFVTGVVRIATCLTFNVTINSTLLFQINYNVVLQLQQPEVINNYFHVFPTFDYQNLTVINSIVGYPGFARSTLFAFGFKWVLNAVGYEIWTNGFNVSDYRYGIWHLGDATEMNLLKEYASVGLEFSNTTSLTEKLLHPPEQTPNYYLIVAFIILCLVPVLIVSLLCAVGKCVGRKLYDGMFKRENTVPLIDPKDKDQ